MKCFEVISSYQKKGIISNKGADAFQACDDSSSYVASVLAYRVIISDGLLYRTMFYFIRYDLQIPSAAGLFYFRSRSMRIRN